MSGKDKPPRPSEPPPKPDETAAREARLAQALRANLRRRKAAARPGDERPAKG
jgi:hypothetical protein